MRSAVRAALRRAPAAILAALLSAAAAGAVDGYALCIRAPGNSGVYTSGDLRLVTVRGSSAASNVKIDSSAWYAQFSPDGQRIAYTHKASDGSAEIVIANRDGTGKSSLKKGYVWNGDFKICWRQPGSIVYGHNEENRVYAIDVSTGAVTTVYTSGRAITSPSVDAARDRLCFWSPDSRGIYIADLNVGPSDEEKVCTDCGNWLSPSGQYYTNNLWESGKEHQTMYVRQWRTTVHKYLSIASTGMYWNRQKWSNNSNSWIIYPRGPSVQLSEWSNAVVHDFQTGETVKLTSGSTYNDRPEDFWVGPSGPAKPTVSTKDATNVTASSARLNGEVTSTGGENPTVKIHWGDNDAGTGSWDHVEDLGTKGAGTFYKDITGLTPGNTYYFRCSASNSAGGTWASSSKSFTTGTPVDPTVITNPSDGQDLVEGENYTLTGTGAGTLEWSYDANSDGEGELPIGGGSSVEFAIPTGVADPRTITIFLAGDGGEVSVLCNIISGSTPEPPAISLEPTSLSFSATQGGANPADKTVSVTNSGGGTLSSVSVSEGASWLSVARSGSGNSQLLTNTCDISGLSADTYSATVTVSGGGAPESASYTVTLTVTSAPPPGTKITSPASGADLVEGLTYTFTGTGAGTLEWSYDANSDGEGELPIGGGSSVEFAIPTGVNDPRQITVFLDADGGRASVTCNIVSTPHLRVNCGANTHDVTGWGRDDSYVSNGEDYTFTVDADTAGVAGAAPVKVYRSCRRDNHSYSFPVPDGDYTLRIHFFDEHNSTLRAADYFAEGTQILDDFNIYAEAGDGKALVKEFSVAVTDGNGLQLVCDRGSGNDVFECGIEIIPGGTANTPPVASDDTAATEEMTPVTIDVLGNDSDADGDSLTVTILTQPAGGEAVSNGDGTVTYTPDSGTTGEDTFTYTVSDGNGGSDAASVTVTVNPAGQESITIISPAAGGVWYVGTTPLIRWTATNVDDVVIQYRTSPAGYWQLIASSVDANVAEWGRYPWQLPDSPSTECRVLIQGYFGEAPTMSGVFEIRSVTDADGDGMDDGWEERYFGDLSHGGSEDTDGDGVTDREEFAAGTDPTRADSADPADGADLGFSCAARRTAGAPGPARALLPLLSVLWLASGRRSRRVRRAGDPR